MGDIYFRIPDAERLHEFTKEEWWDVARSFMPELTWEEFEIMWTDFCEQKLKREASRSLS